MKAKAKVTVRANIDRLVGGAGEETIIARVGEGIVTTIGSSADHKQVLENPDTISTTVLNKGLDAGTAARFCPSISPMWTWVRISAPSCRRTRPRPTSALPRPRRKSAAPWRWLRSRK